LVLVAVEPLVHQVGQLVDCQAKGAAQPELNAGAGPSGDEALVARFVDDPDSSDQDGGAVNLKAFNVLPRPATTIHTRVTIVRSVLRGAVADRVIPVDPSEGVTLPRRRRREAAMQVPSVEQVGRILGGADDDFRAFVALCAFAGLRLGEAAGVQIGDVDFLRRQLAVSRQLQRDGREVAIRPPKYGSERVVYLPEQLVTMLSEHVATYRPGGEPGRWLFADLGGRPLHNNAVTYRWRQTRKAAGIPSIRLHDLRHFYASGLIAAGCDVVTVQRALGHSSATTTLNTYSHLWPTAEDRTRAAAGELWTAALADSLRTSEVH
jgi:integrase